MHNLYGDEPRLNRFLLISVVLHAILFFTLPDLASRLEVDVPGMAGGGVIQIMHVERSTNPRPSPVTDPSPRERYPGSQIPGLCLISLRRKRPLPSPRHPQWRNR